MKRLIFIALFALALPLSAQGAEGLITKESAHDVSETLDRLEALAEERDLQVIERLDHAGAAEQAGESLAPTELLLFGNPAAGTPFMHCARTVAIDLPMKALAWEDEAGTVRLAYNDPGYLAERHGVEDCEVVEQMGQVLEELTERAVGDKELP